ncbi:MAG: hypothetical protein GF364_04940 [Candidatus Lokiarchaeota archaeon]|nr:hypothetical protein [Candidatus Lokiarchaeota archaeon]
MSDIESPITKDIVKRQLKSFLDNNVNENESAFLRSYFEYMKSSNFTGEFSFLWQYYSVVGLAERPGLFLLLLPHLKGKVYSWNWGAILDYYLTNPNIYREFPVMDLMRPLEYLLRTDVYLELLKMTIKAGFKLESYYFLFRIEVNPDLKDFYRTLIINSLDYDKRLTNDEFQLFLEVVIKYFSNIIDDNLFNYTIFQLKQWTPDLCEQHLQKILDFWKYFYNLDSEKTIYYFIQYLRQGSLNKFSISFLKHIQSNETANSLNHTESGKNIIPLIFILKHLDNLFSSLNDYGRIEPLIRQIFKFIHIDYIPQVKKLLEICPLRNSIDAYSALLRSENAVIRTHFKTEYADELINLKNQMEKSRNYGKLDKILNLLVSLDDKQITDQILVYADKITQENVDHRCAEAYIQAFKKINNEEAFSVLTGLLFYYSDQLNTDFVHTIRNAVKTFNE